MNVVICEGDKEFGQAASKWCGTKIALKKAKSLFVPAGQTPVSLYALWESERPSYLSDCTLHQVDDVMNGPQQGMFRAFFEEHLPSFHDQFRFIDNADQVADLAILGLGLNGHVAFHEPGLPNDFFSGCVKLSETTCDHLKLDRGTWGLTYGAGAFKQAKAILMIVKGESKRDVVSRLLKRDASLPASTLLDHPDFTLVADVASLGDHRGSIFQQTT